MLYPFIYTRTKYHDYRVVTSKSLCELAKPIVHFATEIARALIDAENNQLNEPTWTLVKKNGVILWGMAVLNRVLGDESQDKYNRHVRGFFGFITDNQISKLPYEISFFKDLYQKYVIPIWGTYAQTEQVTAEMPPISGVDFIEKSSRLSNEINVEDVLCRVFPDTYDSKSLIEAVFASPIDCSIATNVHQKKQYVEFGKDKISFTNAVMSYDSNVKSIRDIKVHVKVIPPVNITEDSVDGSQNDTSNSFCPECGNPVYENGSLCPDCKNKRQNKKYLKYGLYGFIVVICLLFVTKGSNIWERLLSPKQTHENTYSEDNRDKFPPDEINEQSPFLNTKKLELNIQDASPDQVFEIKYESSSPITTVMTPDSWIRIITQPKTYSTVGIIEITCEPLSQGKRDGIILISNSEGEKLTIPVYQTTSSISEDGVYNAGKSNFRRNQFTNGTSAIPMGNRKTEEAGSLSDNEGEGAGSVESTQL